mgnify:FL=1
MVAFAVVDEFVVASQRVTSPTELRQCLSDAVTDLGFSFFAVVHHVDLVSPPPGAVRLSNYPQSFYEAMARNKYFVDDPVLATCQRVSRGFLWSEVPTLMPITDRQRDIIALGAREGLGAGYTHPVHMPGEYAGSCSYAVRPGQDVDRQRLPLLHYLGCFAFEAGRRLARRKATRETPDAFTLTERQLDCLVLVAGGATAREAASALGVKQDTVQKHLEEAKVRAGVRSTTQLVVRSLFDGLLTFQDLLPALKRHPS